MTDYSALFARRPLGIRLGLEIVAGVHAALGQPGARRPGLVVVGTNGKGSVAAMAAHALGRAGRSVGLYTSPHLSRVTERFRIAGAEIEPPMLQAAIEQVLAAEAGVPGPRPLSFFEVLTLAALVAFENAGVDVIVAEAGLGGRLDATRIVDPAAVVVTSIALDHQNLLGNSLPEIAAEKAGMFRRAVPVFTGSQPPEVWDVLTAAAQHVGCALHRVEPLPSPVLGLPGAHQRSNAALAVAAAQTFVPAITARDVDGVSWPGRLESQPHHGGEVILDVAHNPAALQVLVEHLRTRSWNHPPVVVFGCMADKDAQAMVRILAATGWPLWLVRMSDEGAGDPADWQAPGQPPVFEGVDDPRFASACAEQLEGGGTAVVCGSHRLVGAVRAYLADPERPSLAEPSEGR